MARSVYIPIALLALLGAISGTRALDISDGWVLGRATNWNSEYEKGNCQYGSNIPANRYLGAFPDAQEGFSGSCGRCFLVKCRAASFKDGYGATLDRTGACYDTNKAVLVKITDACPCKYDSNAYSNKRWCCGDMGHVDISEEAFKQLASTSQGVIAVAWKEVDCSGNSVQYLSGNSAGAAPAPASAPASAAPASKPAPASAPAAPATPSTSSTSSDKKGDNDKKGGWGGWGSLIGSWLSKWW